MKKIISILVFAALCVACQTSKAPLTEEQDHPFWSDPDMPWSSVQAWSGGEVWADHSIKN